MAAEISAQLVRELREKTGTGMMDCKRALQETNGDIEAAVVLLREKGMASAAKRADRATTEGLVGYLLADDGSHGTMVAVGCETEPVSKNEEFQAFAQEGARRSSTPTESTRPLRSRTSASSCRPSSARTSRSPARARFEAVNGGRVAAYVHPPANKLGVLVQSPRRRRRPRAQPRDAHLVVDPHWIGREDVPD